MSSYLNLYVKKRDSEEKPLLLISFSRSSNIYQAFNEHFDLYSSTGELTEITQSMIDSLKADIYSDLTRAKNRYTTYLESGNKASLEDIESIKEYIYDLEYCVSEAEFISEIIMGCALKCSDFEGVYAFID